MSELKNIWSDDELKGTFLNFPKNGIGIFHEIIDKLLQDCIKS